jgi:hypothetical protein
MNTSSPKLHRLATSVALAAAAALPLVVATPAQAATSSGCTVNPQRPVFAGFTDSGTKRVRFSVNVSCSGNRTVQILQQRYEEDWDGWLIPNSDDSLGSVSFSRTFESDGSTTVSSVRTLPNTEDGSEEIYQRTRFRVTSNGVTSNWTSYQRTAYVSMPN